MRDSRTATRVLMLIALCGAISCVDDDAARPADFTFTPEPDAGSGDYRCADDDGYEFFSLENFEFGAAAGSWYANNDVCESCPDVAAERDALLASGDAVDVDELDWAESRLADCVAGCTASQNITIFDKPLPAEAIGQGGRCDSTHALRLATAPLTEWGANVGTPLPDVDASEWEGLSFWARRSLSSRGSIRVEFADPQTDGSLVAEGGCNPDFTRDTISQGCDRFGGYVSVSSSWEFHTVSFDEFRQGGWGIPAGSLDVSDLRSLTFLFPTGIWDIWIDDVALYRRPGN